MASDEVLRVQRLLASIQNGKSQDEMERASAASPSMVKPMTRSEGPKCAVTARVLSEEDASDLGNADDWDDTASSRDSRASKGTIIWFSDDGESGRLAVPRKVAVLFGRKNRKFDSLENLKEQIRQISLKEARRYVMALVGKRDYSAVSLKNKLIGLGFERSVVDDAVEGLSGSGLVSDARFAEVFIRSHARKGWGRERIRRGLRESGVSDSEFDEELDRLLPASGEYERALESVRRRRLAAKNPIPKLANYLVYLGYPSAVAIQAAKEHVRRESYDG